MSGSGDKDAFARRKTLSAHNAAAMRTVVDCGEYGQLTLDEPAAHGGTARDRRRCRPYSRHCAGVRR